MKLSLQDYTLGDAVILYCEGRIVYRAEAAALARVAGEALEQCSQVVLELSGVENIDGAGLGELVLAHLRAREQGKELKLAGASARVRELLELTNLSSVLAVYASVAEAMDFGGGMSPLIESAVDSFAEFGD